ncbi:pirin family protein [Pedobacter duraquae]|uniref:Quercetin 2,3-dioxygenase C-terminal cupin domain-containing protein n=1 Tax=Pedobacter duraquae TaxID=425511 RepID=A0A4R6IKP3_9SPHI|nr:hypothetical protein [Pedobacter duraquae]TDO22660.1 hypothetical protein CLV32_1640 [Pedobacter duraquae]
MEASSGKIFLSEQRGTIETALYQRNCTFNFDTFFNEHKGPFDPLYLFNDELLEGAATIRMDIEKPTYIILVPITGDLRYTGCGKVLEDVLVGQLFVMKLDRESNFSISNPYESDAISYLQIWIAASDDRPMLPYTVDFELGMLPNALISLIADQDKTSPFNLNIGSFEGRSEITYQKRGSASRFFCFVVAGAFEVEGRLLHAKDGLALWDTDAVEMEALSNNALILTMEI